MKTYYDQKYFNWQKQIGEFGGMANKIFFEKYVQDVFAVMDFGCGGGYLLKNLSCYKKIGIEINKTAAKISRQNGVEHYFSINAYKGKPVDLIISSNVLEHVHHPLVILQQLYTKLKKHGKIVFIVPCESYTVSYQEDDINQHLYTWNPLSIGNLFKLAGFKVITVKTVFHKWPPFYYNLYKLLGENIFHQLAYLYGWLNRGLVKVIIEAEK